MAVVQGIREKVHLPIYDCFTVKPNEQLGDVPDASNTNVLKFFVNVQGKTKLQTNLQSASLLPHYNTFEARAMRVVISDLPPEFSEDRKILVVGSKIANESTQDQEVNLSVSRAMELLKEAEGTDPGTTEITVDPATKEEVESGGTNVTLSVGDLEAALEDSAKGPPRVQIRPNNGAGTVIGKFIYNTVATLFVGEKLMIQMPTWFFPAGAGPFSEAAHFTTHGQPDPMATFRFAEPVFIDKQQNFRVELEFPDGDVHRDIKRIYGPLFIWVVLDGFMIRDVQ